MSKINRCVICEEKLVGGRCPLCGLDHRKMMKTEYRLNTTRPYQTAQNTAPQRTTAERTTSQRTASQRNTAQRTTAQRTTSQRTAPQRTAPQRTAAQRTTAQKPAEKSSVYQKYQTAQQKVEKWAGKRIEKRVYETRMAGSFIRLIPVVVVLVLLFIGKIIEEFSYGTYEPEPVMEISGYDPYEYAEYQLSDTGEEFSADLTPGEYVVGVHIPEGYYSVEILEGESYLNIEDIENGIYDWYSMGFDDDSGSVTRIDDLRLYQNSLITIEDSCVMHFETANGQLSKMNAEKNSLPADTVILLDASQQYVVGEDFPAGVYDVTMEEGWGTLECGAASDSTDSGWEYSHYIWLNAQESDSSYKNIVLNEGVLINVDIYEGKYLELTPSEIIDPQGYEAYYDLYW